MVADHAATVEAQWPAVLTVEPIDHAEGVVRLPGSKSISNRALLLAALADGTTELTRLLDAEDTRVMIEALRALGIAIERDGDRARVSGCGGRLPARSASLFLGNAGTATRSLTAALAFAGGDYRIDGVARMRERPIGDLVDALNALGACIGYEGEVGFPPLQIGPARQLVRDQVSIRGKRHPFFEAWQPKQHFGFGAVSVDLLENPRPQQVLFDFTRRILEAQVDRMLHNITTLLARQGATVEDLVSGVTYLKNPNDAPVLRSIFRDRGFDRFPGPLVEAPLCRPELLCEAEAVAMLPLPAAGG